jgi:hypothetical protein
MRYGLEMEPFAFSPKTLFTNKRANTLYEAVWGYVMSVGAVTLLSVITGTLFALFMSGDNATLCMRLINGVVVFALTSYLLKLKKKEKIYFPLAVIAAALSACGYEIVGLMIPAFLTKCGAK